MEGLSFETIKAIKIVVTRNTEFKAPDGWKVASSPDDAMVKVRDAGIKQVILAGGGKLNASFAEQGLIDEVILNIEPVLVGEGRNIFAEKVFDINLRLLNTKKLDADIVQLRYVVEK